MFLPAIHLIPDTELYFPASHSFPICCYMYSFCIHYFHFHANQKIHLLLMFVCFGQSSLFHLLLCYQQTLFLSAVDIYIFLPVTLILPVNDFIFLPATQFHLILTAVFSCHPPLLLMLLFLTFPNQRHLYHVMCCHKPFLFHLLFTFIFSRQPLL